MGLIVNSIGKVSSLIAGAGIFIGGLQAGNTQADEKLTSPQEQAIAVDTLESTQDLSGPLEYLVQWATDKFYIEEQIKQNPKGMLLSLSPDYTFRHFQYIKGQQYERELLEIATAKDPYAAKSFFANNSFDSNAYSDLEKQASSMVGVSDGLRTKIGPNGFQARKTHLIHSLNQINGEVEEALNEFNSQCWGRLLLYENLVGHSSIELSKQDAKRFDKDRYEPVFLIPIGIQKLPYEFVFVALNKNMPPDRIGITPVELKRCKTKEDLIELFKNKIDKERKSSTSTKLQREYSYQIPCDGKTACVFVCIPKHLAGIETDILRLMEIYKDDYKASVYGICMENRNEWLKSIIKQNPQLINIFSQKDLLEAINVLFPYSGTENDILRNIETSAKRAIDEGKSTLNIHYLVHGTEAGEVCAEKNTVSPTKLIDILIGEYKGKPISEQLDINIIATSCYSGKQLDTMLSYLKQKNIGVRALRIVTDSKYTPSWAATSIENATIPSDGMAFDRSATSLYNLSCYREIIKGLQQEGFEVPSEFNSFFYNYQFVRVFSQKDSPTGQVLQAIYYHNNPTNKTENHITQAF